MSSGHWFSQLPNHHFHTLILADNDRQNKISLVAYRIIHILSANMAFQVVLLSYAGLAVLVGLAGGEAAHIVISDGRVLGLKVYSTLPGSSKHSGMGSVPSLQVLATG